MKIFSWTMLLVLSLVLGNSLRTPGYNIIPEPYIILDEHTNVWHGLSIRKTGIPTAWSILSVYISDSKITGAGGPLNGFNLSVDNKKPTLANFSTFPKPVVGLKEFDFGRGVNNTPLVQPYLDHPPFGAIALSLFVSNKARSLTDVNDFDLRQSSLYLAIITQILIFIVALLITRKPILGLLASIVYATVPSYLLLSRYALLENVLSPLVLFGLIFLIFAKNRLNDKKTDRIFNFMIVMASIFGGLGALTKLTGWVFIFGYITLLYIWRFKFRHILMYVIPAVLIGSLYFVWGFYLAPKLFTDLLLLQTNRDFIGSINLLVTFFRVSIFNFPLDGWWIGGFITLLLIPKEEKYLPIAVVVVTSLVSALCLVGTNYPWYFITLIPFMAIAIAIFFYQLATKPNFTSILLTFFAFVSSSFYWGYGVYQKTQPFMLYRLIFLLFVSMAIFWSFKQDAHNTTKKLWQIGVVILLLLLVILNRESMFFILKHWGKLPLIYTPGTF